MKINIIGSILMYMIFHLTIKSSSTMEHASTSSQRGSQTSAAANRNPVNLDNHNLELILPLGYIIEGRKFYRLPGEEKYPIKEENDISYAENLSKKGFSQGRIQRIANKLRESGKPNAAEFFLAMHGQNGDISRVRQPHKDELLSTLPDINREVIERENSFATRRP